MKYDVNKWAEFLTQTRAFCKELGLTEVTTPMLVEAGAFEGVLDAIQASTPSQHWELHTSPEIEMKALIAETKMSIYQITKCFRDDPETGIHLKEFTMLEYYRMGADYRDLMNDIDKLIPQKTERISMENVLRRTCGFGFEGIRETSNDSWEDAFNRILIDKIEPSLNPETPTILYDYPAQCCALGKKSSDGKTVERFELFWKKMEICNGCSELTSLEELENRYKKESSIRRARGLKPHPFPNRLAYALEKGLPKCAGIAIGLDRLFWAMR